MIGVAIGREADGPGKHGSESSSPALSPVVIPYDSRDRGVTIIGRSGTGKSTILERLLLADLNDGTPGVLIDPHGLLAERLIALAPSGAADRIILLEPSVTNSFGLNLLACREPIDAEDDPVAWAADSTVTAVKKLYGEQDQYLPRLEHYLDLAVRTLIPSNGTLLDTPRLFRNERYRAQCIARVDDPDVLDEWSTYEALRKTDQITHIEAVVNRLTRLLRPRIIRGIVGSPVTTVPFDEVLNGRGMLVVSLPSLRITPERCNFIGALVLGALADQIFARSVTQLPPRLHLYLDEYQRFATPTIAELLTQGRKYGVGLTLAHQGRAQVEDRGVGQAELQAATLIVLGVSRADADVLAGEFPVSPREEWIERVVEPDGEELVRAPTREPLQHLQTTRHENHVVSEAANLVLVHITGDGVTPAPRSLRDYGAQLNELLVDVMLGHVNADLAVEDRQFATRLFDVVKNLHTRRGRTYDILGDKFSFEQYFLAPKDKTQRSYPDSPEWPWDVHDTVRVEFRRDWFDVMLSLYRESIDRNGKFPDEVEKLTLHVTFLRRFWHLAHAALNSGKQLGETEGRYVERYVPTLQRYEKLLMATFVLCDGLQRAPILVPTGQQKLRMRTHLVVHPRQNEQDARNEFAARLVNPPQPYHAHVRLPTGYHYTRLSAPTPVATGTSQIDRVRELSRARFAVPEELFEGQDHDDPIQRMPIKETPPPISRRPLP